MERNPIQPMYEDEDGVSRFKGNAIVQYLLDNGGIDMNQLARLDFTNDDRVQFAQLIGYSLAGFDELSYVDDETYTAVELISNRGITEQEATIEALQTTLDSVRTDMRDGIATLYGIHPDNLI